MTSSEANPGTDMGEDPEARSNYLQYLAEQQLGNKALAYTHYDDKATGDNQFPFSD